MTSHQFFRVWKDFKSKKELYWRPFEGSSTLSDNSKSFSVYILKQK